MPRSLATTDGRYTHDEVVAAYLSPGKSLDSRYELRDRFGNTIRRLTNLVEDATISLDSDSEVKGACRMILGADEDLLNHPLQYRIACFVSIGPMRDGGRAEHTAGVYVLPDPARSIAVGPDGVDDDETFMVTMPDQQMILEGSPPVDGFSVAEGEPVTDGVKRAMKEAGISDTSGVVESDEVFEHSLRWTTKRGAERRVRKPDRKYNRALARWQKRQARGKGGRRPRRYKWKQQEENPETWNGILGDMADSIGYDPGFFDLDGLYRFLPARDLAADPPDFRYIAGKDGVLLDYVNVEPNYEEFTNRVKARQTNPNGKVKVAESDLNVLLPDHPLAQHQHGIYFDLPLDENRSGSQDALQRRADRTLLDSATYYSTARLVTAALPLWLLGDLYGLELPGVLGFSGEEIWAGIGWAMNLFGEPMEHDVRRTYRTAT